MRKLILAGALALAACQGVTPDQATTARIQADIVKACLSSPLFKMATGTATMVVPAATLPVAIINAGVDQVCADPARFANDASTVEWVFKNLTKRS